MRSNSDLHGHHVTHTHTQHMHGKLVCTCCTGRGVCRWKRKKGWAQRLRRSSDAQLARHRTGLSVPAQGMPGAPGNARVT